MKKDVRPMFAITLDSDKYITITHEIIFLIHFSKSMEVKIIKMRFYLENWKVNVFFPSH
jgi:hypothetical protein